MVNKKKSILLLLITSLIFAVNAPVMIFAQDTEDESATFNSVAPDALILLDLSGSMAQNPDGTDYSMGSSSSCTADSSSGHCTGHSGDCSGGFCQNSHTGCSVDCSKLAIAKRAIANILDDDGNGTIDVQDSNSLNIRIGFARFYNGNYSTVRGIGTTYQQIFCGATGTGSSCAITATSCVSGECVAGEQASGGTPLATSLGSVKTYLDANKAADPAGACRQKFVIVISDGADTYACGGDGTECQSGMYKRRRATVAATKALKDAGYKVFVVGFGSAMPDYLENTLNWMAYFGGTDNPDLDNAGDPSAYTNVTTCDAAADQSATCQGNSTAHFRATSNDPGYVTLSGYAFLAGNADDLNAALRSAFSSISAATYSFTQASIQAVRTVDENFVYEASFQPVDYDPFWIGHLKRYSILTDGSVNGAADWDAGDILSNRAGNTRHVWSYKTGALTSFTTAAMTIADLSVTSTTQGT